MTVEESRIAIGELIRPHAGRGRARRESADEADWRLIIEGAARHRVLPLLHWRIRQADGSEVPSLPPAVADLLHTEMLRSIQQGLRALATARRIDEVLTDAGVPVLFLKGVHLAADVYPRPGLRPMRDIDALVPEDRALDALAALERIGAAREPGSDGNLDAWRSAMHHLPVLVMPRDGARVEIHTDLSPREQLSADGVKSAPGWNELWSRSAAIDCAGRSVRVLSPEDLLVHLVVHAVYHHRLSNGPLALADVGFLLARHRIDWAAVWRAAERQRVVRGCVLLLGMLEREWGPQRIDWHGHHDHVDEQVLHAAAMLMLQESVLPGNLAVAAATAARAGGPGPSSGKAHGHRLASIGRLAVQRFFLPRRDLALMYPVEADSLSAFAWYPRHWWRLVSKRLPEYLRYRRLPGVAVDVRATDVLEGWLRA